MKKKLISMITFLTLAMLIVPAASAYQPYTNYTYTSDSITEVEPQAYMPTKLITGKSLGISDFSQPEDIFVSDSGNVYISDSGNNRVIVLDRNLVLKKIISSFKNAGKPDGFQKPSGLFVASNNHIYIADTDNQRVVVVDQAGNLVKIYSTPDSALMKDHAFSPTKVSVDFANRVFVVSANENRGMLEFAEDGTFNGFFGAVKTTSSFNIFKLFATKIQRSTMEQVVPVVYSNVNIDKSGFVYGTVSMIDVSGTVNNNIFVRKMNPVGTDILKRYGTVPVIGDANWIKVDKVPQLSQICDIALRKNGIYSVLGQRYGRIFTYDDNGNLLYVFGALGTSFGQFANPVAIDVINDKDYLILDRNNSQIIMFTPTKYGKLLTEASVDYYQRKYDQAEQKYDEILNYTTKLGLAYIGKGKCLYRQKNYAEAMKYFKLGDDRTNYSQAYHYYRMQVMNRYFSPVMTVMVLLILILTAFLKIRKRRSGKH